MNKVLTGVVIIAVLLLPQTAAAHVLIRDEARQTGAILHIVPDDDPIAGEPSELYFDIQSQALQDGDYTAELRITGDSGQTETVPTFTEGNFVEALYTFPSQGAYQVRLTVTADEAAHTFTHAQRVTRGVSNSPLSQPRHAWAEMALVGSASGFLLLLVLAFNHRREIARKSKF